jgi:hypothetical protein
VNHGVDASARPEDLDRDLLQSLPPQFAVESLEGELRREAEELVHLSKQTLGGIDILIDPRRESVQTPCLLLQMVKARRNDGSFSLDIGADVLGQFDSGHGFTVRIGSDETSCRRRAG